MKARAAPNYASSEFINFLHFWDMADRNYIHGYSSQEQERLVDQARVLDQFIFENIDLSDVDHLLEVGSGVCAQTVLILERYPNIRITCIEYDERQIEAAQQHVLSNPNYSDRITLIHADATDLKLADDQFDAAYICWVLEHVPDPVSILKETRRLLKPGAAAYLTEVAHNNLHLEPHTPSAMKLWQQIIDTQAALGGNANIGFQLSNLCAAAGFDSIQTWPKNMFFDRTQAEHRDTLLNYWNGLIASNFDVLLEQGVGSHEEFNSVMEKVEELRKDPNAVFSYAFIQAKAIA